MNLRPGSTINFIVERDGTPHPYIARVRNIVGCWTDAESSPPRDLFICRTQLGSVVVRLRNLPVGSHHPRWTVYDTVEQAARGLDTRDPLQLRALREAGWFSQIAQEV